MLRLLLDDGCQYSAGTTINFETADLALSVYGESVARPERIHKDNRRLSYIGRWTEGSADRGTDMSEDPVAVDPSTPGYLSETSKRRFTITAGVLGAVFLIAQFAIPFAIMLGFMASMSASFDVDIVWRDPDHTVVWDGAVWLIETHPSFNDEPDTSVLARTGIATPGEPEPMVSDLRGRPFLLPDNDRLWLISKDSISYYRNGEIETVESPTALAEFSSPFLMENRPAVLERWPNELVLVAYDGASWQNRGSLPIVAPDPECGCGLSWAKAVADGRGVHVFLEFGSTIYYGLWAPDSNAEVRWERVADSGKGWAPVIWRGTPAIFRVASDDSDGELLGHRRDDEGWHEFVDLGRRGWDDVNISRVLDQDTLIVFLGYSNVGGSVEWVGTDGTTILSEGRIGDRTGAMDAMPKFMMIIMGTQYGAMIVVPFILAVILSAMMRRHRVTEFSGAAHEARFASLTRRAVAQFIDLVIVAGPGIGAFPFMMWKSMSGPIEEPSTFADGVAFFIPMLAGIGWAILTALIFTYSEGRSGVTPGKWITRIRVVGTDLQPCGFGRALVRNLLKCIDGFLNFMVGIMVVALSENWQRVGDMAARTIVVEWNPQDTRR